MLAVKPLTITTPRGTQTISVGHRIHGELAATISAYKFDKVIVITPSDPPATLTTALQPTLESLNPDHVVRLPKGQTFKTLGKAEHIISELVAAGATRHSCLVAIGGGEISDLVGFTAAIYMRGIPMVHIPTTLMAMGDAVMGKVAVDHQGHKNLLGAFYSPILTWCDTSLLEHLPQRHLAEGLVEIWKHSLLADDHDMRKQVEALLDTGLKGEYTTLVKRSLEVKAHHVEPDFLETKHLHKALSLGHTLANYLEVKHKLSHGEAILIGILHTAIVARNREMISAQTFSKIENSIQKFDQYLQTLDTIAQLSPDDTIKHLLHDKGFRHGNFHFVCPTEHGYAIIHLEVQELKDSLEKLRQTYA